MSDNSGYRKLTFADLNSRYEEMVERVICRCTAATPIVGGVPGGDDGIRAFIQHHLEITDPVEAEKTFQRMKKEEMGQKDITPETGELKEQLTYGINKIRRTEIGPYLGNWMIHANIKTAMSRLGMFIELKGTKGNVAEGGMVRPFGVSKLDDRPDTVYLVGPDGKPAVTHFEEFKGRVSSAQGSVSVVHHSECVPAGTKFEYEFLFLRGKLSEQDIIDALALSMIVGLGSVKSLGHGKFRIDELEIIAPTKERVKIAAPKASAKAKAEGEKIEKEQAAADGAAA